MTSPCAFKSDDGDGAYNLTLMGVCDVMEHSAPNPNQPKPKNKTNILMGTAKRKEYHCRIEAN